jgi:hypothetical protein
MELGCAGEIHALRSGTGHIWIGGLCATASELNKKSPRYIYGNSF